MSKEIGIISELQFAVEALKRGFKLYQPFGDSSAYDYIVRDGTKFSRVQVKGTSTKDRGGYTFQTKHSNKNRRYGNAEIEFFALHIQPTNSWLIVPVRAVTSTTVKIHEGKTNKYRKFKDKWNLLNCTARRAK